MLTQIFSDDNSFANFLILKDEFSKFEKKWVLKTPGTFFDAVKDSLVLDLEPKFADNIIGGVSKFGLKLSENSILPDEKTKAIIDDAETSALEKINEFNESVPKRLR